MADRPSPLVVAVVLGAAFLLLSGRARASARGDSGDPNAPGPLPNFSWDPNVNADNTAAASPMQLEPSAQLAAWLKAKESLLLDKTDLGDGGFTIGWGHFEARGSKAAAAMPDSITQSDADALFSDGPVPAWVSQSSPDLDARGAAVVRKYVNVPLTQNQFDALTSLAYNLSQTSFAQIADAVNQGAGIDPIAYNFVRAGTQFEAGLTARRNAEVAMFESGVYA